MERVNDLLVQSYTLALLPGPTVKGYNSATEDFTGVLVGVAGQAVIATQVRIDSNLIFRVEVKLKDQVNGRRFFENT